MGYTKGLNDRLFKEQDGRHYIKTRNAYPFSSRKDSEIRCIYAATS
jgi:hypothetical protein